jgi:hypothetical protein
MTADLSAHGNLMGGVRAATKPHKLKQKKKKPKKEEDVTDKKSSETTDRTNSPGNKYDFIAKGGTPEGEVVDESATNRGRALDDNGIQRVSSQRVYPAAKELPGSRRELNAPRGGSKPTGPNAITPPGPTARETASAKAKASSKGTKNTSTIKVAEQSVDLEEGPTFGKPVYNITDVPRQWKKNG